jgi:hypothetical protein
MRQHKWEALVTDCRACPLLDKCIKKQKKGNKRGSKKTILTVDLQGKENLSEAMRKKIDDPVCRQLYAERMRIIEPCFANITCNKGMNRFLYIGKEKNNTQWLLFITVHNIGKCIPVMAKKWRKRW